MDSNGHFRYEQEGKKRVGAYDPGLAGIRFVIEVDTDQCTEQEQNEWANWITKAIAAKLGHDKHEKDIIDFVNSISFHVRSKILNAEQVKKVQEVFHWAAAYALGFDKMRKEIEEYDWDGQYGPVHHLGRPDESDGQ